ncbi:thioredoxin family protein [Simplicispira suum]|uniref:Thiol reductase thioredoxin n=1 Tax=Simplicispira suum TaxID=2109915 RepID=A0A2S0N2R0_9BURK|nr:thioredoxin family protein [Simplicispira suum]AVO42327.1 thiol reductase thioredoxin [Simplicispira suum]MBW7831753.1 thioredoxin family protein [Simplicispira suum]
MQRSADTIAQAEAWWVVCLCAAWCNTCTDYRPIFLAVARDWPQMRFEWVDIEDESELAGDLDVETFPTLLIADAHGARFLGPLLPHAAVLSRLIASLQDAGHVAQAEVDSEAQAVFHRVRLARA